MAKYLVTGGCGFIGSHLVERLIKRGDQVRILDDLSTGKRERAAQEAELLIGSITEKNDLKRALSGVDGCFHLAAVASVETSIKRWSATHLVNLFGTIQLFETIAEQGHPIPVVYASSAAVYGGLDRLPLKESESISPLSPYGVDKLGCELQAAVAYHLFGIPSVGFRIFNVYGPHQDPSSPYSGVIALFNDKIAQGTPITIFGDGEQQRDFVYVGDVVRFLVAAMKRENTQAELFNLCTGRGTSINRLAELIGKMAQLEVKKEYQPSRKGDLPLSIGDPTKAETYFGIKANTPFEEGLMEIKKLLK
ncbi:MAG: UDP-N-acetylglucosamine 4-epimerase [Chlamydiae bacterium]|nr:UDP-N-acetylglucosamine 4-epimerase [Chlamydiota bacterium]